MNKDTSTATQDEAQAAKFAFGDKVRFKSTAKVLPYFQNKDFCLLGFSDCAFSLIEWERRGGYGFEYLTGKVEKMLEKVK